jgi:hypothetical protein
MESDCEVKKLPFGPKTLTHTEPTILASEWDTPENIADHVGSRKTLSERSILELDW